MPGRRLSLIDPEGPRGLRALVAVPEDPAGAPLLCFLHGHGEAAPVDIEKALTKFGPLSPQAPPELAARFLIVAPQLPLAGDSWHHQAGSVQSLLLRLQARYGADPARRYLTGFSYGGNGVFDLALISPGFWTALWPVDPTRWPARPVAEPVWLSIGDCVRPHVDKYITALQSRPPQHESLADRIHLDEGEDHVGSAIRAYADSRIYQWLLARPHS